ncbi:MAG: xanthine dehydrogenase molybdopterin binding subunit [Gammaproteobacteria bacterium]|nr:xanthine dehydrogenase molybdopterin binding subunit [Gammaproteobacteria bacterium]NNF60421.1 xanthine dehydrogenase molybdopterin binding subunit [Gammaproteobacteria bacterium]NNM20651.1 xanthine dehydrogenase molybdopterin binding subunit [Gammaproteobacteria bacterium]
MDAERHDRSVTVGKPLPHDSAPGHVSGRAVYTDDIPEPRDLLHVAVGLSSEAHARVKNLDLDKVRTAPGVVAVINAADIPGVNNYGAMVEDDPIFADGEVQYAGQALFAVAADTVEQARRAALLADVSYEPLPAVLGIDEAVRQGQSVLPTERLQRGQANDAIAAAPHRLQGKLELGGQDQFYLEGQIAMVLPREAGEMQVYSSTQFPGEVQHKVAHAIGTEAKDVVVECRRMGGGFGGKETQPALIACIAAVVAQRTGRPAKLRLDRDTDMLLTGKRHDFRTNYEVGFDDTGRIHGINFDFASRCGMSADLSGPVNDRCMFHADNAYYLEHLDIVSHRCKTNTVSNTAFRGFGGPQGMYAIEYVIDEIARQLGKDPLEVRRRNFYGVDDRNVTPYGQVVEDNIIHDLADRLEQTSDYQQRRANIDRFNAASELCKRGIALTPVKFGISFTATHLNQAGALLHIYTDGTVRLNHGGTEMGQGLYIKVAQVVADELQISLDRIRLTAADTSKVPNASATAASASSDMNGKAAQAAARTIKARLVAFACKKYGVAPDEIVFASNQVSVGTEQMSFADLVQQAHMARVSLSATGFYKTPKIHYDRATFSGRPFYYYAYGAAVSEVVIDVLTGEHRLLRVDILHDCGRSLNPAVDLGQIEGGYIQGYGWLTSEELWWDENGRLQTHAPSTYKIPTCSDVPADFRVEMLQSADNREQTIHRSKAVGEPPLMLGLSAFFAIRDAVASASGNPHPPLTAPATPEAILRAVMHK